MLDRITTDFTRLNGAPCIRDLRLTVRRVLEALAIYPDRAKLKREYPELEDEDIRQVLIFAAASVGDEDLLVQRTCDHLLQSQGKVRLSHSWRELKEDR